LVCFFSDAQMSHDIACRITAIPPVRTVFPRFHRIRALLHSLAWRALLQPRRQTDWSNLGNAFLYFIARKGE
jgi:hypothetical protein